MFIIELTYKVALDKIDAEMKAHVAYLEKYYDAGVFITWGRKVPRNGGIILAKADSKSAVGKIIKEDPFYKRKLADYRVIEFIDRKSLDKI